MKIRPKKTRRQSEVIALRLDEGTKEDLEFIRRAFPEFTDSQILRAIIRAAAEDVLKKGKRG